VIVLVGAGLVAVGCVATVLTLAPLLLDADPLPVAFYLLCFLGPIGLALILVGLWRSARARTRQLQRAGEGLPPRLPG
jgi:threonine/homoserine/homoserine lactone efflux protein